MSRNNHTKALARLKITAIISIMVALSIVFGKFLSIKVGDVLRFSFENLPIIFAGVAFGPVAGILTGVVADILGCVLYGYAINPIVTVGAAVIGLFSGLSGIILKKRGLTVKTLTAVLSSHIFGSVIVKTFGLAKYYDMPFFELMLWRLGNYAVIGLLEFILLRLLLGNSAISRQIESMVKSSRGDRK